MFCFLGRNGSLSGRAGGSVLGSHLHGSAMFSTDDVSIGAPALRDMAYVIAVGVGKKIKEPELVTIAGAKVSYLV